MSKHWVLSLLVWLCSFPIASSTTVQLVTLDYPPYIVHHEGELSGVAVELVEAVFDELDVPISIEVLPWARALSNVQFGRADAIFTAFKNPTREKFADYSNEILFTQNISLVVKRSSKISSYDFLSRDVSAVAICAVNRVSYGKQMDALLADGRFRLVFWRNRTEDCARLVRTGRADVWVNNDFGARSILASEQMEQALEILSPPIEATPSYIAFSKLKEHQWLRDRFDRVLREMKEDGRYEAIIDDYFDSLKTAPSKEKG
ncbi:substrate-binding periplasmic protein [Vibrio europaeus]|uniref:Amino acid ABC transporter n=1 Tax=Vibrio europaeus TaxID=300876 RepID=A0A178JIC0_9VIBR|nr:transporter substrate-binding domain-containing protein [Vibrio europaeus]MDC5704307.1 transporter substrate-binding domain-containing protein [Vibrio europaeus]MDC5708937.1 transporter substrate-binding domain-containing protein [Vibrio europaeus]MDC5717723.1 transporter substrate-binding domain-containing protein [Vibrio europaeus]MDC5718792.1 transporter substrate-binding domain-containing protein [Vibrio europaeus]MDC5727776.1 transporter substrate-binding domain-containing protein [Vib